MPLSQEDLDKLIEVSLAGRLAMTPEQNAENKEKMMAAMAKKILTYQVEILPCK